VEKNPRYVLKFLKTVGHNIIYICSKKRLYTSEDEIIMKIDNNKTVFKVIAKKKKKKNGLEWSKKNIKRINFIISGYFYNELFLSY